MLATPTAQALLDEVRLRKFYKKVLRTERASLISYLPLREVSGAVAVDLSGNGYNGAYSGVTLGQPGIGDGWTCPLFDGSTSYVDWYSAGLAAAFDGTEGTLLIPAKVANAGVWTDGVNRRLVQLQADVNNYIILHNLGASGVIRVSFSAGGEGDSVDSATQSTIDWLTVLATWSLSDDFLRLYLDSVSVGIPAPALGTFVGTLANTSTLIGASSLTPTEVWSGNIAHPALWSKALTPAQIAYLRI